MCTTCGCAAPGPHDPLHRHRHAHEEPPPGGGRTLYPAADLYALNDRFAAANRARFKAAGVLALNLVSSPGAGKTTLLERTLRERSGVWRCAVLAGDQQTSRDAERIAACSVPVRQINTGSACHLDAHQVGHGVDSFQLSATDLLLIENVGNLVCPAGFDLGESHKVVLLSVAEGEDKPLKYPQIFRAASLLLITKLDLLPHLDFALPRCRDFAREVNPQLTIIELSCRSGAGLDAWYAWLERELRAGRERTAATGR